jgi:hypothetical protein
MTALDDRSRGVAMRRNPLTGKRFRVGDEYLLHVKADGTECIVPDTEEWRGKSIRVRVVTIYRDDGFWHEDGVDEIVTGARIGILDESFARPRPKNLRPRGREWCLAENSPEDAPMWSRIRTWELVPV